MVESHFIVLEPDKELEFARPFTAVVKQTLTIYNQHPTAAIAFKVKTTAPKQYCVRPNAGKIPPNTQCQVQILLQAMREDPPEDVKCKDKFLVQAITIPKDLLTTTAGADIDPSVSEAEEEAAAAKLSELWALAEQQKKAESSDGSASAANSIIEKKLRCVYTGSSSSAIAADKDQDHPTSTTTASGTSPVAAANTATTTTSSSKLGADVELLEAKETIKKLTASLENYKNEVNKLSGLRQRKGTGAAGDGQTTVATTGASRALATKNGGFGIEVVALVAILGLLIGIFFF